VKRQPDSEVEEAVYAETIRYGAWFPMMLLVLFGILITGVVIALLARNRRLVVFPALLIVALFLVYMNFRRLSFEVTNSYVRFGFGLLKKEFPRSDITSCEPYKLTFQNYLGYGIRFGLDGTIAYNTRNGRGVKMVVEGRKRPYVVSVNDPGRVCELLQQRVR
jgi:hypothetical protein